MPSGGKGSFTIIGPGGTFTAPYDAPVTAEEIRAVFGYDDTTAGLKQRITWLEDGLRAIVAAETGVKKWAFRSYVLHVARGVLGRDA